MARLQRNRGRNLATADPIASAAAAHLHYVSDASPGIRRRRSRNGFVYLDPRARRVRSRRELRRIQSLVIPPAWTDVWICPDPEGHLQAVGRDARGRKQYRYHERWRSVRDRVKYDRMLAFARALPRIRRRVRRELARPGLSRSKVLAAVVRLLESTLIRVGNTQYVRENNSRGLTTLANRHVDVRGTRLRFRFRGKSGRSHEIEMSDSRLAAVVRRCKEIPGQELFQYLDEEGTPQTVSSGDVNRYLREVSGVDFTAKDFRTWAGSVLANASLERSAVARSTAEAKRTVARVVAAVAARLGNTPATCRKAYIHPSIIDRYLERAAREKLRASSPGKGRMSIRLSKRLADALGADDASPLETAA